MKTTRKITDSKINIFSGNNYLLLGKHSKDFFHYLLNVFPIKGNYFQFGLFLWVFSKCWDSKVSQSSNMIPIVQYCPNQIPRDFSCLGWICWLVNGESECWAWNVESAGSSISVKQNKKSACCFHVYIHMFACGLLVNIFAYIAALRIYVQNSCMIGNRVKLLIFVFTYQ